MKESRYKKINIKDIFIKNKKILFIIIIILLIVSIDQTIKYYIFKSIYNSSMPVFDGILNLTYIENTGGAYGIGSNSIIMFIITNIVVIGLLTKFILLKRDEISIEIISAMSLIIAGGLGNLIDRIFRGHVIDYIDINPLFKYPVFNISDICIVLGCIIIIMSIIVNNAKNINQ